MLGRQRRRCASSRQFEIAIGLTSRQTKFARQRHGRLRHASSVRQQPPCRSQSVGLLLSRGTNHLTQPYYRLRRKSTAFLPRKPTIVRSKWKLSFAFREPSHHCWRTSTCAGSCWDGRCSAGAKPRLSHRDLCGRPRDPVRKGKAEQALQHLRELMGKLKL